MRSCRAGERGSYGRDLVAGVRSLNADGKGDGHEKGRTHLFRWRPAFMYLGLYLEVGEVTCVSLPLVMLVWEFPFPSTCVFPLRVSALFPIAADPKDPFPSCVGVPAPTKPKSGKGHAIAGPFPAPCPQRRRNAGDMRSMSPESGRVGSIVDFSGKKRPWVCVCGFAGAG